MAETAAIVLIMCVQRVCKTMLKLLLENIYMQMNSVYLFPLSVADALFQKCRFQK